MVETTSADYGLLATHAHWRNSWHDDFPHSSNSNIIRARRMEKAHNEWADSHYRWLRREWQWRALISVNRGREQWPLQVHGAAFIKRTNIGLYLLQRTNTATAFGCYLVIELHRTVLFMRFFFGFPLHSLIMELNGKSCSHCWYNILLLPRCRRVSASIDLFSPFMHCFVVICVCAIAVKLAPHHLCVSSLSPFSVWSSLYRPILPLFNTTFRQLVVICV